MSRWSFQLTAAMAAAIAVSAFLAVASAENGFPEPVRELTLPGLRLVQPTLTGTRPNTYYAPTEFPPVDSEQRYWACLVQSDPINRKGILRHENRDRLLTFSLLPSAMLFYRGAPASLADIPEGTMVEVWAYSDTDSQTPRHVLRISDDFSVKAFARQNYRVDSVKPAEWLFTATLITANRDTPAPYEISRATTSLPSPPAEESQVVFRYNDQTRWYLGDRIVDSSALVVGQQIQTNYIRRFNNDHPVITRCTEVWLDQPSQDLATRLQLKSFVNHQRDRGYPLRIDSVDDAARRIVATLLETGLDRPHREWRPGTGYYMSPASASLRMWEPAGGQGGPDGIGNVTLVKLEETPVGYGSGGAQVTLEVPYLVEGFRPGHILKVYPPGVNCPCLPIEERLPKEFDPFLR